MRLSVEGREFEVDIAPGQIKVDGKPFKIDIKGASGEKTAVHVDGMPYQVEIKERRGSEVVVAIGGKSYNVILETPSRAPLAARPSRPAPVDAPASAPHPKVEAKAPEPAKTVTKEEAPVCDMPYLDGVTAVMPGRILSVKVQEGQAVKMGTVLCILEAMKMENEIRAPKDGTVTNLQVKDGTIVNGGDLLMMVC